MTTKQIETRLAKISKILGEAQTEARALVEDMEVAFDDRNERWQESDTGTAFAELTSTIDEWADTLDDCSENAPTIEDLPK